MNEQAEPKLANKSLLFIDLLVIGIVYWVFSRYQAVGTAIAAAENIISFNDRFFFYCGALIVPVVHGFAYARVRWPQIYRRCLEKISAWVFIAVVVSAWILAVIMGNVMSSKLEDAGYHYCEIASSHQRLSSQRVYVSDLVHCVKNPSQSPLAE